MHNYKLSLKIHPMKSKIILTISICFLCLTALSQQVLNVKDSIQAEILQTESHKYSFKAIKGQFLNFVVNQIGIDLKVSLYSPQNSLIMEVDSPNGQNGPEHVNFRSPSSGNYIIKVIPLNDTIFNSKAGKYSIVFRNITDSKDYSRLLEKEKNEETEFISWINKKSIPIKTVEAESGFDDLNNLKSLLADRLVVGLGEATHGTKEFFQMKHRMVEFLVKELGFNVFAIEASYSRCKYINDYVLRGIGNLDTATAIQGFWVWRTEEVRDLIKWIKEYNDMNPDNKVSFVGFDLQVNDAAALKISQIYHYYNNEKASEIDTLLKNVIHFESDRTSLAECKRLLSEIDKLILNLVNSKGEYLLSMTDSEFDDFLWNHRILHQYLLAYSYSVIPQNDSLSYYRDKFMAENIFSWIDILPKNSKIVVWAHNGHITFDNVYLGFPAMGKYLKEHLKEKYYSIGFDFQRGKFQSNDRDSNPMTLTEFEIGDSGKNKLSSYFMKTNQNCSFIDFHNIDNKVAENWINNRKIGIYMMGSMFSNQLPASSYIVETKLAKAFDGMFVFKETSRAIPIQKLQINQFKIE